MTNSDPEVLARYCEGDRLMCDIERNIMQSHARLVQLLHSKRSILTARNRFALDVPDIATWEGEGGR